MIEEHLEKWRSPTTLPIEFRREFRELVEYCFPYGKLQQVTHEDENVIVEYSTDGDSTVIDELLSLAFERVCKDIPRSGTQTLMELPASTPHSLLGTTGLDTTMVGHGLMVGGPEMTRLIRSVDMMVRRLALELEAEEFTVPHLVSSETLERSGYALSCPQHLTGCTVAPTDLRTLDAIAMGNGENGAELLVPGSTYLAPSVCISLFADIAHRQPIIESAALATAVGSCTRYEAIAESDRLRLWSFTMREIVVIGGMDSVHSFRHMILGRLQDLAMEIGLPCRLVTANDPFFTNERSNLATFQSSFELKHELIGIMPDGREVAISSVNLHNQHFGLGFGLSLLGDKLAHSACIGFGLERWAQWVGAYLGDRAADWPDVLRRE